MWIKGLFYILLEKKIPPKFFNIINSLYEETKFRVKMFDGLSKPFLSACGVLQGDVLRPFMFNIFINGIVETLQDENSDSVLIGNTSINTLLYADDLVLLSSNLQGLQNCLEKLSVFCASWKLVVNISKSKALIFNSNGKSFSNHFYYNNSIIETVTQYCYLGITLKYNGNVGLATSILMEKARKALFKMKKSSGLNNPCKLLEKLFDSIIVPIMFYGCEIWGIESVLKCKD